MTHFCAICEHLDMPPRTTTSVVSVAADRPIRGMAAGAESPAAIPVCPEHVVDVYRGRVPGVAMAWRVLPSAPLR